MTDHKETQHDQRDDRANQTPKRGGMPGDGKGRMEQAGGPDAGGVYPLSGSAGQPTGDAEVKPLEAIGQGKRGIKGYQDHGESEVETIPDEPPGGATSGQH